MAGFDAETESLINRFQWLYKRKPKRPIVGDGNGNVYSATRPGYALVRYRASDGRYTRAYEVRVRGTVRLVPGNPVEVYPDSEGEDAIFGADFSAQLQSGFNPLRENPADELVSGDVATTDIHIFSCSPQNPPSMSVAVFSLMYVANRTVHLYNGEAHDLTSDVPSAGNHLLAGIFLKPDNTIDAYCSTAQPTVEELDLTDVQECITASPVGAIANTFWRLYGGMTTVTQADKWLDGRQFVNMPDSVVTVSTANTANPPTDAELTSAFGAPLDGFIGLLDDNDAGANVYLVARRGGEWWYAAMSKAT